MNVPKISVELQVPLLDGSPRSASASPSIVSPRKPGTAELPMEDILKLDPESLIDYCEARRHLPPPSTPLTWQHGVGMGVLGLCAASIIGYHIYRADARSAARAIRMLAPPPFAGFDDTEIA